jgi:hypothetical protein
LYPFVQYEYPYDRGFAETLSLSLTNLPRMALEMSLCLWAGLALFDLWIVKERRHEAVRTSVVKFLPRIFTNLH